jgi:hypothetical protein
VRSADNGATGAANILDLASGVIVSADNTVLQVTPAGKKYLPSVTNPIDSDRPIALSAVVAPWEVAAIFGSTGGTEALTESRADPVVIHNKVTGAYVAFINQANPGFANRGLTSAEFISNWVRTVIGLRNPSLAADPNPAEGAVDVLRDATLSWTAGQYPSTHDVYLGTTFADVNSASRTSPKGVLASQGQADATFDPAGSFAYGQTYYWRVDEVNQTADGTISKGTVWSFTAEPYGYPVKPVSATASSAQASMGPENTINGSGLTGDLHGTEGTTMWLSTGVQPNWIQYQFDKAYKLFDLKVWNSNQPIEAFIGFGAKKVTIEYSTDGTTWTAVANVPEFARASGALGYAANTTVNLGGVLAKYVKLTINSTWGGLSAVTGLSEVRFSYAPVQAREPQPATAATGVSVDASLSWRPGREAGSHKVFLGTDQAAVTSGTAPAQTVADHSFDPSALTYGTTYYWRVDEVNTVTYPGDVWSFTTREFAVVEDFESYDDNDNRIYDTWIDGLTDGKSGSIVGYDKAPFAEQTIRHGGKQSMPLTYDNTKTPFYSETTRDLATPQNWTANGANTLVLYVQGRGPDFAITSAATAPVIDGKVDTVWAGVPALPIKTLIDGAALTGPADASGQFRVLYDSTNLYVLVDVNDEKLCNDSAATYLDDSVEVYIDGGNTKGQPPLAGNARQYTFGWTDAVIAGTNTNVTGVQVAQTNTPTGWRIEIKFPWSSLIGAAAPVGKLIGIDCFYNDDDDGGDTRESQIAWHSKLNTDWQTPASWGTARVAAPGETQSSDLFYVALQDSANHRAVVTYPGPEILRAGWNEWRIPLSAFSSAGVNLTAVKKMSLGVGNRNSPKAGDTGIVYIDDIGYGKPAQ